MNALLFTAILKIACFGDSVTAGYRVQSNEAYCSQLNGTNFGVSQNTTTDGLTRIQTVIDSKPKLVLIMFGLNDAYIDAGQTLPRTSLTQYKANLLTIVKAFRRADIKPVLMTPNASTHTDFNYQLRPYVDAVRLIAKEHHVLLVDNYEVFAEAQIEGLTDSLYADWQHPNATGQSLMFNNILSVLRSS